MKLYSRSLGPERVRPGMNFRDGFHLKTSEESRFFPAFFLLPAYCLDLASNVGFGLSVLHEKQRETRGGTHTVQKSHTRTVGKLSK